MFYSETAKMSLTGAAGITSLAQTINILAALAKISNTRTQGKIITHGNSNIFCIKASNLIFFLPKFSCFPVNEPFVSNVNIKFKMHAKNPLLNHSLLLRI